MSCPRRPLRRRAGLTALLGLTGVVLVAAPAGAHPFFQDGEAPASSLATVTLDLAHGCTGEDGGHTHGEDGTEAATTDVALEIPEVVTHVTPHPADGWDVDVEELDERIAVVTWTDAGGAEPAPTFDLDLVVDADEGEEIWFKVVQACDDVVYRWIGTPDEPADDPAAVLRLTAPDPDAPAPEPEDPAEDPAAEPDDADPTGAPEPADEAADEAADDEPTEEPVDEQEDAAAPDGGTGGTQPLLWVALGGAAAVIVGLVLWRRTRSGAT